MEQRKNQFLVYCISLLSIGFLQYYRKIANGYKLSKIGKILYLTTMVIFTITIIIVLYYTNLNNIISFLLGLVVTINSEQLAKLFLIIGNNFNKIVARFFKSFTGIDFMQDIKKDLNKTESEIINND